MKVLSNTYLISAAESIKVMELISADIAEFVLFCVLIVYALYIIKKYAAQNCDLFWGSHTIKFHFKVIYLI